MEKTEFIEKQLRLAQQRIKQNYPIQPEKIQQKTKHEIVTPIDKEIEQQIIQNIKNTYPKHNILGEETGLTQKDSEYTWILDPIDGTTNYAHNIPFFCTAITLLKNQEPIHTGIIQPLTNDVWTATKNKGATKNGNPIKTKPKPFQQSLFGYCHKETNLQDTLSIVHYLKQNAYDARRYGSANLELALVADGSLQGFIGHNLPPWDFKPGCLLIQEAYGTVQGWNQKTWKNKDTKNIIATPKEPNEELLRKLQEKL